MRIRTRPIEIDETEPFKNLFPDRTRFGKSLHNLLNSSDGGFVAFIDGQWGQGKSTFIRAFKEYVKKTPAGEAPEPEKHREIPDLIVFDAFAHESTEDPFASFSYEISAFIGDFIPEERDEFLKRSAEVIFKIAGAFTSKAVGLGMAAFAASDGADPSMAIALGSGTSSAATDSLEIAKSKLSDSLKHASGLEEDAEAFSESLSKVATAYREATGFPLTVVVDELDRCSPRYALKLIERIKHYFEVDELCFLIFANMEQIERHITKAYGAIDSANYLRKFADVALSFPSNFGVAVPNYDKNAVQHARSIRKQFECRNSMYDEIWDAFFAMVTPLQLSLREVEYVARNLMLLEASEERPAGMAGALAAIRVKDLRGYNQLKEGVVDHDGFFKLLGFEPESPPKDFEYQAMEFAFSFLPKSEALRVRDSLGIGEDFTPKKEYKYARKKAVAALELFKL